MYEHLDQPLIDGVSFVKRLFAHVAVVLAVVGGSLALGAIGFYAFGGLNWLDAFVNSAMMLTTMGPVATITSVAGKLFLTFFAFYSELIFLVVASVLFAPFIHRFLHRFHLGAAGQ